MYGIFSSCFDVDMHVSMFNVNYGYYFDFILSFKEFNPNLVVDAPNNMLPIHFILGFG